MERQGGDSYWRQCRNRSVDRGQVGAEWCARRGARQERKHTQGKLLLIDIVKILYQSSDPISMNIIITDRARNESWKNDLNL